MGAHMGAEPGSCSRHRSWVHSFLVLKGFSEILLNRAVVAVALSRSAAQTGLQVRRVCDAHAVDLPNMPRRTGGR